MWPFRSKTKSPSGALNPDAALAELHRMGVGLRPGVTAEDLVESLRGDSATPVDRTRLLCALGEEAESGELVRYSDDIWHFDAECIEDEGDYARLAERFLALTHGELSFTNLRDHVDVEGGEAWFEFTNNGRVERWTLTVDNDWMDPAFYTRFQKLLSAAGSKRRFMICALGQDSLVLCGDEKLREQISAFSGLKFEWE